MVNLLADWKRLHAMRVDGRRPVGSVYVLDLEKEVTFIRSKGAFALHLPWRGDLPDVRCLTDLDLIVSLKGRRYSGDDGLNLLQEMVAADPHSMLAKWGLNAPMKWIVKVPQNDAHQAG